MVELRARENKRFSKSIGQIHRKSFGKTSTSARVVGLYRLLRQFSRYLYRQRKTRKLELAVRDIQSSGAQIATPISHQYKNFTR